MFQAASFRRRSGKGLGIPYRQTRTYAVVVEAPEAIRKKSAYRAVANANGANQIAIVDSMTSYY
ncbi:MAG: hypothetical protein MRQ07_02890 [Candidatus Midichloria sp.]|nr:hypothetical protein [Candidatus Midichloria sp.]